MLNSHMIAITLDKPLIPSVKLNALISIIIQVIVSIKL